MNPASPNGGRTNFDEMRGAIEKLAKEFNEHAAKLIAAPSKWELALKAE